MLFTTMTVGDTEYKLKLDAKNTVDLEKKLGTNPINKLIDIAGDSKVPSLTDMLTILHYSLQAYQHGISFEDTFAIYNSYVDEGHSLMDLVPLLIEVFRVSGFLPEEKEEKPTKGKKSKNA